jgi:hypothetical protein
MQNLIQFNPQRLSPQHGLLLTQSLGLLPDL